jgi:hypothetical protein
MANGRSAARRAPPFVDPPGYAQHRPERTVLYHLVQQHYPAFLAGREAVGRPLPKYLREEFEAYLKCGARVRLPASALREMSHRIARRVQL